MSTLTLQVVIGSAALLVIASILASQALGNVAVSGAGYSLGLSDALVGVLLRPRGGAEQKLG